MRILHLDAGNEWRGGQQQVLLLIEGLARADHVNVLATPPRSPLAERGAAVGCETALWTLGGEWDIRSALKMRRFLRSVRFDVVHFHDSRSAAIGSLVPKRSLPPVVVARRVDFPLKRNAFSRRKYQRADRVVAVSEGVKRVMVQSGVQPEKIRVVHDGVALSRFRSLAPRRKLRALFDMPFDGLILGVAAALEDHKGHRYLLQAMPTILSRLPTTRLYLAGDGSLRKDLERQVEELGIAGAVTFLGRIEKVPEFLNTLDLFVLPSHLEGLCQGLIEAMAAGAACLSTLAGGIPEVIEDGRSGVLVPPKDPSALAEAALGLLADPSRRAALGQAALQRSSRFSQDEMVKGTLRVYEEIVPQS